MTRLLVSCRIWWSTWTAQSWRGYRGNERQLTQMSLTMQSKMLSWKTVLWSELLQLNLTVETDVTEEKQIADFIQRTFECKRYSYSPCSQLCSAEYYRTVCTDCQALERNERDFMVMGQIQTMLRDDTPKGSKAPAREVHTSFYHKEYCICATFRFLHSLSYKYTNLKSHYLQHGLVQGFTKHTA